MAKRKHQIPMEHSTYHFHGDTEGGPAEGRIRRIKRMRLLEVSICGPTADIPYVHDEPVWEVDDWEDIPAEDVSSASSASSAQTADNPDAKPE